MGFCATKNMHLQNFVEKPKLKLFLQKDQNTIKLGLGNKKAARSYMRVGP